MEVAIVIGCGGGGGGALLLRIATASVARTAIASRNDIAIIVL
tara:strand:- start:521 stop:649 length:129 start_codon:yes stop_codon:yes gene_type:complete